MSAHTGGCSWFDAVRSRCRCHVIHPAKHRFIDPIRVFVQSIEIFYDFGMLDLIRLRVLVAVAQEGSVTAAADYLGYAQPSISHHLRQLESEVGVPLFQRAGRGLRLTDAGAVLVRRATEILGHVDAAVGRSPDVRRTEDRATTTGRIPVSPGEFDSAGDGSVHVPVPRCVHQPR